MSRPHLPYEVGDISALARSLANELNKRNELEPNRGTGHVEWLNILAKAAGYKNFQHFRANHAAENRLNRATPPSEPVDHQLIEKVSGHFDEKGILKRWPSKASHRDLCLWWLWSRMPVGISQSERDVNELIKTWIQFEDHVSVRRALCDYGFVQRSRDGSAYQRVEQRPPRTASEFIRHVGLGLKLS